MGAALACLVPWFAANLFWPPVVDLTASADSVDYEFRDERYADEFLALNQDTPDET